MVGTLRMTHLIYKGMQLVECYYNSKGGLVQSMKIGSNLNTMTTDLGKRLRVAIEL